VAIVGVSSQSQSVQAFFAWLKVPFVRLTDDGRYMLSFFFLVIPDTHSCHKCFCDKNAKSHWNIWLRRKLT